MSLSVRLRNYLLQQCYGLPDTGAEEVLYDMLPMRNFAGLDLVHNGLPYKMDPELSTPSGASKTCRGSV